VYLDLGGGVQVILAVRQRQLDQGHAARHGEGRRFEDAVGVAESGSRKGAGGGMDDHGGYACHERTGQSGGNVDNGKRLEAVQCMGGDVPDTVDPCPCLPADT